MPTPTPKAPSVTPAPAPGRAPVLFGRIDLNEPRNLIGLGVMAFCLGVMAGARIMRGAVPPAEPGPVQYKPCPKCQEEAEAIIQARRAAAQPRPQPAATTPQPAPAPPETVAGPDAAQPPNEAHTAELAAEDAERAAAVATQLAGTDGAPKRFSPYAESVLPAEHVVSNGDSSVPVGE